MSENEEGFVLSDDAKAIVDYIKTVFGYATRDETIGHALGILEAICSNRNCRYIKIKGKGEMYTDVVIKMDEIKGSR